jgi:hypothetical protein
LAQIVDSCFSLFDRDNVSVKQRNRLAADFLLAQDGNIDFVEFVYALSLCCAGKKDEKLKCA